MTKSATAKANPIKGVLFVSLAVLFFAMSDVLGKFLVERHPVSLVMAVRYFLSFILVVAVFWPRHRSRIWQTQQTTMVILRGIVLALASLTMGLALQLMPVGETIAIMYLSPFAVMLLAIPLLGERLTVMEWIGALIGFAGVLFIMRPGSGLNPQGVTYALLNAGCATAYLLMTRSLAKTETTLAMMFYVTLVGAIFFGVSALPVLGSTMPSRTDFSLMLVLGVTATTGHFLLTKAYREAPASLLAPMNYFHLVWAAILGWFVFHHLPDGLSLVGMALICLSGMAIALRAHFVRRKPESIIAPTE